MSPVDGTAAWTGSLVLRPGRSVPDGVRMDRPMLAARLARGVAADRLPGLMAGLHNLCAGAHRACSRRALRAAAIVGGHEAGARSPARGEEGKDADDAKDAKDTKDAKDEAGLEALAIADHLRRIVLDWPRELLWSDPTARDALAATAARALQPLMAQARAGGGIGASPGREPERRWLESQLGMPADAWRQAWSIDGTAWLRAWGRRQVGWLPSLIRAALAKDTDAVITAASGLRPTGMEADTLRRLGRELLAGRTPADALRSAASPIELGAMSVAPVASSAASVATDALHTGCWSRAAVSTGPVSPLSAGGLLGARIAELATLVSAPGRDRVLAGGGALAGGQVSVDRHVGLGWVETARGLLIHVVRLHAPKGTDAPGRVDACVVVAPTDWNFCDRGAFAAALARIAPDDEAAVRVLACAFDPCMPFDVVVEHGAGVAGAGVAHA